MTRPQIAEIFEIDLATGQNVSRELILNRDGRISFEIVGSADITDFEIDYKFHPSSTSYNDSMSGTDFQATDDERIIRTSANQVNSLTAGQIAWIQLKLGNIYSLRFKVTTTGSTKIRGSL